MTHLMEDMVLPPPNNEDIQTRLEQINQLKYFLSTAPTHWDAHPNDPPLQRYSLPTGESVSCVRWLQGFFISGTDIVRSLVFRFHAFGRPVQNLKKFEEGVFSDLRNLKPGTDATLEEPKSSFLDLLYKHNCIRTQKKQKVFNWFSVPHDRLFLDALERDLKRNKLGTDATSEAVALPALSITLDTTQALFDEFRKDLLSDLDLNACLIGDPRGIQKLTLPTSSSSSLSMMKEDSPLASNTTAIFGHFSLFEGSPTYKQRRRRTPHSSRSDQHHSPHHQHSDAQVSFRPSGWPYNNEQHLASLVSPKSSSDIVDDPSRLYTCPLSSCQKIFKRLEHLKRHLRTHTMERPYLCGQCGKRFSRSDNLAQHKKTHKRRQRSLNETNSDTSDHGNNHHHPSSSNMSTPQRDQQPPQKRQMQQSHFENRRSHDIPHHQQNSHHSTVVKSSPLPSSSSMYSQNHHNQHHHQGSVNWLPAATIPPITVTFKENSNQGHPLHDFFPTMSASTSSSSISSCQSSPTAIPPITSQLLVKDEQYPFDTCHQQQQRQQQTTPTTPTTTMDDLLSIAHQPHSSHHHHQQQQQEGNRDWQFNMDWEQGSCLSSPQSSSLFIHPSASSSSSSSTSTSAYGPSVSSSSPVSHLQHHHQQPAVAAAAAASPSSFYSAPFRMNYDQQQQQHQHPTPPSSSTSNDQESTSLKSMGNSYYYRPPPSYTSIDPENPSLKSMGTNTETGYYYSPPPPPPPPSGLQDISFRSLDPLMHF